MDEQEWLKELRELGKWAFHAQHEIEDQKAAIAVLRQENEKLRESQRSENEKSSARLQVVEIASKMHEFKIGLYSTIAGAAISIAVNWFLNKG